MASYQDPISKGKSLEDLYFDKMRSKLGSSGMNQDDADEVSANLIYPKAESAGRTYLNAPMYESLKDVPLKDQLNLMNEHQKELQSQPQLDESSKYLPQLNVGERYASRGPSSEMPDRFLERQPEEDFQQEDNQSKSTFSGKEEPALTKREQSNIGNVGGDMMVGASHALLGLLSGNFNRAAMEYGKADQYLSGQRAQDIKNLSNLKTVVGPTGAPTYVPAIEAADQQAYVKPMMKTYAPQYLKNTKTGEVKPASWNGRDFVSTDPEGNPVVLSPNEWFKYQPDKVLRAGTPSGGVSFTGYNPVTQGLSNIKTTQGLGDIVTDESGRPLPKQVAEANIKTAAKSAGKVSDYQDVVDNLNEAKKVMSDPNTTGAQFASAAEQAMKAMVNQRLPTAEAMRMSGSQYMTGLQYFRNLAENKIEGKPSEWQRQNMLNMIETGIGEANAKIGSRKNIAGQIKGLNVGAPTPSKESQAQLIQYDRAAAAKWGKGSDLYNQFMAKKKQELGM